MVKIYTNQNGQLFKVTCLSTDDKPIGVVPANTICEELDTGDKYFYDPVSSQWFPYPGGSGSGSGLPDPSSLPDGTALIKVGNEWKMQEGYGYSEEVEEEILSETEVETVAAPGYPVALADFPAIDIIDGDEYHVIFDGIEYSLHATSVIVTELEISYLGEIIDANVVFDNFPFFVNSMENLYTSPENAGVHTISIYHVTSTVHQFDPALIPGVVPAAPSEDGTYVLTCTITDGEAVYSWETNE